MGPAWLASLVVGSVTGATILDAWDRRTLVAAQIGLMAAKDAGEVTGAPPDRSGFG